jgi:hypothetical protein
LIVLAIDFIYKFYIFGEKHPVGSLPSPSGRRWPKGRMRGLGKLIFLLMIFAKTYLHPRFE